MLFLLIAALALIIFQYFTSLAEIKYLNNRLSKEKMALLIHKDFADSPYVKNLLSITGGQYTPHIVNQLGFAEKEFNGVSNGVKQYYVGTMFELLPAINDKLTKQSDFKLMAINTTTNSFENLKRKINLLQSTQSEDAVSSVWCSSVDLPPFLVTEVRNAQLNIIDLQGVKHFNLAKFFELFKELKKFEYSTAEIENTLLKSPFSKLLNINAAGFRFSGALFLAYCLNNKKYDDVFNALWRFNNFLIDHEELDDNQNIINSLRNWFKKNPSIDEVAKMYSKMPARFQNLGFKTMSFMVMVTADLKQSMFISVSLAVSDRYIDLSGEVVIANNIHNVINRSKVKVDSYFIAETDEELVSLFTFKHFDINNLTAVEIEGTRLNMKDELILDEDDLNELGETPYQL